MIGKSSLNWNGFSGSRLVLAAAVCLAATLACSRANVPANGAVGSGVLVPEPAPSSIPVDPISTPQQESRPEEDAASSLTPYSAMESPEEVVTAEPEILVPPVSPTFPPTVPASNQQSSGQIMYTVQPGDTLNAVAVRFGVIPVDIVSSSGSGLDAEGFMDPGLLLLIPNRLDESSPSEKLLPDSEIVYSPHAADFSAVDFAAEQGGFLNAYREIVGGEWHSGGEVVEIAARDNSINPRLLLSILEYHSNWVTNPRRPSGDAFDYPLGLIDDEHKGLYRQLTWLSNEIGKGYYGWRAGTMVDVRLADGSYQRFAPELNAGTVALQYYFGRRHGLANWERAISPLGWPAVYERLFGDPWSYMHPLYEPGIEQPDMILPFLPGRIWAFTGGPHGAWEREAAWAALDFAPSTSESGCVVSEDWAVAAAPGLVIRSSRGVVLLDLDGDGREQTGWNLLYLHIADEGRVPEGAFVEQGERIGHPSCEGGIATGTHIHIARKYNGEWILADGPLSFRLSGWEAVAGSKPYQGMLIKDDRQVFASEFATQETLIWR